MKITRSSKTTLKFITASKRQQLDQIMGEYSRVVNLFIGDFWGQDYEAKDLLKEITNAPVSWVSARIRQCAAREALGMVNGAKEAALSLDKPPIKPNHYGSKMTLSAQCVTIADDINSFWKRSSTVVIHRDYVQFSFELETGPKLKEGHLVGLDVGINHLIATSDNELIGSKVKDLINTIKRKQQGSKAYKRAKKTLSYYLHKQVKDYFNANPALRLVVVERLKGLKQGKQKNRGKAFRKTLSNWNYRELLNIIEMRTQEGRASFRSINPYKTSQQCPNCSHIERGNRSGEKFRCLGCGYSNNADLVGALNILDRFTSGAYGPAFKT